MDQALLPLQRDQTTDPEAGTLAGCVTVRVGLPDQAVVVLDLELIQRLEATLKAIRAMEGVTGLVVASTSERVFIAGADLKAIQGLTDDQLDKYLAYGQRVFGMIADLPYPTAAAINGAALGGGLELAMHCDGLIGAPSASGKPYPVGLPEAGLSICPGWGGTNLLPARMADAAEAIRRTAEGKPLTYDEAVKAGVFDAVAPSAPDLLKTAKEWIAGVKHKGAAAWTGGGGGGGRRDGAPSRWIGRPGRAAAVTAALFQVEDSLPQTGSTAAVLAAIRSGLERGWPAALETERRHLVRLRGEPAGRDAIRAFFLKAAAPKK